MPDGRPPELPETAPVELREFIECKRASVTISSGPLDWLPLPPDIKDYAPTPKLDLTPGASPGTGTLTIDLMVTSFALPVSVVGGDLQIDASSLSSIPGAQEAIDTWVKDFNDWLKKNGQRLKPTTIAGGSVTLTKEPIPAPPPGVAPPPAPPVPPVAPVTPTPPAGGGGIGGGCALFGLLGVLLVGAIGAAWFSGLIPGSGGGGSGATVSTGPTASTAVGVPSTSARPSVGSSTAPQASVSAKPSTSTGPSADPAPANAEPALEWITEFTGLTAEGIEDLEWVTDLISDMYFPQPGQTPQQYFPESDVTGATGFSLTLTPEVIASINETVTCAKDHVLAATKYRVACNQDQPLQPGDYVGFIATQAGGYPSEFPSAGIHSWSVSTNPDDDRATGFTSTAPDNYLIGADTFHEMVAFTDASGVLNYYILATRMADPVRTDTGQRQGNLPTRARAIWFHETGTLLWLIPEDDFGPNWYAGNFASLNRGANSPANLAADALLSPSHDEWLEYFTIDQILKP